MRLRIKMTKGDSVKYANTDEVMNILDADGWRMEVIKPKEEAAPAKKSVKKLAKKLAKK